MTDLTTQLTTSIEALSTGGRFVPAWELPTEDVLHAVQAQLWLGVRTQRRLRVEVVLPMPTKVSP